MAWNKALPADTSKIRLSPAYIRDNWDAIETGLVPYDYLQLQQQASDPSTVASTGWLYSKAASGVSEAFYKNSSGTAIQLTSNGKIGSASTNLIVGTGQFTNITFNGTYNNTQNAFCSAWGLVNSSGALLTGFGIASATPVGTGIYTVTFSVALSSAQYAITAVGIDSSVPTHNRVPMIIAQTVNGFTIRMQRIDNSADADCRFAFAVFGGR